jgi:hypothetical protein
MSDLFALLNQPIPMYLQELLQISPTLRSEKRRAPIKRVAALRLKCASGYFPCLIAAS